jgi:putative RNA 2'-phosphotransferase
MFDKHFFKFLKYLLAHHPEEFGLIPDINGFFKIKEIFQVLIFTKNFKKMKLETLKLAFSYYYKDFFEFLENFNKVKPKRVYYSPPVKINFSQYKNLSLFLDGGQAPIRL